MLNYICPLFNCGPTKSKLYLVFIDGLGRKDIKELQTKGTIQEMLFEMGIGEGSQIIVYNDLPGKQTHSERMADI